MRTTEHLGLEYGGLTYDGGAEMIAGRNLDKIVAELDRLAVLAEIAAPTGFRRGATVNDAGLESAARDNLVLIQSALAAIGTAATEPGTLTLDTSLAALDGGTSKAMAANLLAIDAECARLSGLLAEAD